MAVSSGYGVFRRWPAVCGELERGILDKILGGKREGAGGVPTAVYPVNPPNTHDRNSVTGHGGRELVVSEENARRGSTIRTA